MCNSRRLHSRPQADLLGSPIKDLGLHDGDRRLHPKLEVTIQLNVARSARRAELQAVQVESRNWPQKKKLQPN